MPRRGVQNLLNRWLCVNKESVNLSKDGFLQAPVDSESLKPRPYPRKSKSPGKARPRRKKRASFAGHELSSADNEFESYTSNADDAATVATAITESTLTSSSRSLVSRGESGRRAARRFSAPAIITCAAIEIIETPRLPSLGTAQPNDAPQAVHIPQHFAQVPLPANILSNTAVPSLPSTALASELNRAINRAMEATPPDVLPLLQEGRGAGMQESDTSPLLSMLLEESLRIAPLNVGHISAARAGNSNKRLKSAISRLKGQELMRQREAEDMTRVASSRLAE